MRGLDVTLLFPNRERVRRVRRGRAPRKYVLAPSYEEMIKSAYNILVMDRQESGRSIITFFLIKKENHFGYMKITEDKGYPISTLCDSYPAFQNLYDDMYCNVDWYTSLERLIVSRTTKPKARVSNELFMNKIKEMFPQELMNLETQEKVIAIESFPPTRDFDIVDNVPTVTFRAFP